MWLRELETYFLSLKVLHRGNSGRSRFLPQTEWKAVEYFTFTSSSDFPWQFLEDSFLFYVLSFQNKVGAVAWLLVLAPGECPLRPLGRGVQGCLCAWSWAQPRQWESQEAYILFVLFIFFWFVYLINICFIFKMDIWFFFFSWSDRSTDLLRPIMYLVKKDMKVIFLFTE